MFNRHKIANQMVSRISAVMKDHTTMSLIIILLGCGMVGATYLHFKNKNNVAVDSVTPLDNLPEIAKNMKLAKGCPVPISGLVYLKLRYWGFDNKEHIGGLIVNKELGQDVLDIFKELFNSKFPIEQMRPIYEFNYNDDESMEANNTSAFNCREVTGQPGIFSQHSYGRAIDINPQINPYVKNNIVLPENGRSHVDRNNPEKGKITPQSHIYKLFTERGWDWGGNWHDLQDLQHFEKRANGEKREPNGYSFKKP